MKNRILTWGLLSLGLIGEAWGQEAPMTQEIFINEVVQSTFGGTLDRLKEYPDGWVELYNPGPNGISLKDYRISKKSKFSKGYILPDVTIPAGGYQVILCDKEDIVCYSTANPSLVREIHTDFRLPSFEEGGVYLYNPQGGLVDSLHLKVTPSLNVGYGRLTDGSDSLGYQLQNTMGRANSGGHGRVLPSVRFSVSSWAIKEKPEGPKFFVLKRSRMPAMPDGGEKPQNAVVRYTTDGSEPCDTSAILDSNGLLVLTSKVVKAAYFCEGYITPLADVREFIFHGREIPMPIVSLVMDEADLYSSEYGIITNNNSHDKSQQHNWRRPAYFNYYPAGGNSARIDQRVEVRISGAYSREAALKSMILYADKRFGTTDYFGLNFWSKTISDAPRSKSISIRNSGNDFGNSYFRDALAQMVMGLNTDLDWQAAQPAIFYLNGEYKGLMNIRERGNEDNVWTHHNYLEDIVLVENGELKEGDWQEYQDFVDFYSTEGHTFEEFNAVMDLEEYTNMMITNIFQSNTDFPGNNNVMWKPMSEGGRWRFIIKDVDRAFGIWGNFSSQEYLNWVTRRQSNISPSEAANNEHSTRLFRNLLKVPEYRDMFIDRFSVYMGDFLNAGYINVWMDWFQEQMEPEWDYFKALYSINAKNSWKNEINNMKNWTKERPGHMYNQLRDYFSMGHLVDSRVNSGVTNAASYKIRINGVPLTKGIFDGKLFAGREYNFEGGVNDSQYAIIGWEVTTTDMWGTTNRQQLFEESLNYIIPEGTKSFSINAIRGLNGIEEIERETLDADVVRVTYYNLHGVASDVPFSGVNSVKVEMSDGSVVVEKRYFK